MGRHCGAGRVALGSAARLVSFTIVREVRDYRGKLPASARHLLQVMASHCNHNRGDRSCKVSCNTLADETGQDRRTVLRNIDVLLAWHAIEASKRFGSTTTYTILPADNWRTTGDTLPPPTSDTMPPVAGAPVAPVPVTSRPKPVTPRHQTGDTLPPEVSIKEKSRTRERGATHTPEVVDTPALSSSPKGEKANPVTMDTTMPEGLIPLIRKERPDLTDDDIERAFGTFKAHNLNVALKDAALKGKLLAWMMRERKAQTTQQDDGQVPGWRTDDKALDKEAKRIGYPARPGETFEGLRQRVHRYHETPDQRRARVVEEMHGPTPFSSIPLDITSECMRIDDDCGELT